MERTITIDGKEVRFRASAAIPRLYRIKFQRDVIQDMAEVQKALKAQKDPEASTLPMETLTVFENLAYIMARHADPEHVPADVDDWLEGFNTFSIYTVFPQMLDLWGANLVQINEPVKK